MKTLTEDDQQAVDWTVSAALEERSHCMRVVYRTEDDAIFHSEQAAELYLGLTHILDNLEPLLLAPAFAAFINESILPDE
jgi:hypothetical protein